MLPSPADFTSSGGVQVKLLLTSMHAPLPLLVTELWEAERSIFLEALSDRASRTLFATVGSSSSHPLAYLPCTQASVQ